MDEQDLHEYQRVCGKLLGANVKLVKRDSAIALLTDKLSQQKGTIDNLSAEIGKLKRKAKRRLK